MVSTEDSKDANWLEGACHKRTIDLNGQGNIQLSNEDVIAILECEIPSPVPISMYMIIVEDRRLNGLLFPITRLTPERQLLNPPPSSRFYTFGKGTVYIPRNISWRDNNGNAIDSQESPGTMNCQPQTCFIHYLMDTAKNINQGYIILDRSFLENPDFTLKTTTPSLVVFFSNYLQPTIAIQLAGVKSCLFQEYCKIKEGLEQKLQQEPENNTLRKQIEQYNTYVNIYQEFESFATDKILFLDGPKTTLPALSNTSISYEQRELEKKNTPSIEVLFPNKIEDTEKLIKVLKSELIKMQLLQAALALNEEERIIISLETSEKVQEWIAHLEKVRDIQQKGIDSLARLTDEQRMQEVYLEVARTESLQELDKLKSSRPK